MLISDIVSIDESNESKFSHPNLSVLDLRARQHELGSQSTANIRIKQRAFAAKCIHTGVPCAKSKKSSIQIKSKGYLASEVALL